MHPSFKILFDEIESQREKTLLAVKHLSAEQINRVPAPGKWSIAQILSHLITAERLSLMYINKKIQGIAEAEDSGAWEEIKMGLLKISQRWPGLKFRAPQKVVEHTTFYQDLPTIGQEWDKVRKELSALFETIPDQYVNRKIYRHVRAGYLNARHALIFFREHITHHVPQIKKLANKN